jgi:hypothetical protein
MNMNTKISHAALIALMSLSLCIQSASADGRRIIIMLRNGQELGGESLSAREKSLVVTIVNNMSDRQLTDHPEFIGAVPQQEIRTVTIKSKWHVLVGMRIGWIVGTVAGIISGSSSRHHDQLDAVGGGALGGLGGLMIGTLIGAFGSKPGEEIDTDSLQDLLYFRQYARYQKDEPEFLKTFGR